MVVASASGRTAIAIAQHRFTVPVVGVSNSDETLRRMCLYWGAHPLAEAPTESRLQLLTHIVEWGKRERLLTTGDRIVLVSGEVAASVGHNILYVHEVE